MIWRLSPLRRVVEKMPIVSITPLLPPASTKSPWRKGLKINSMTPAAKFASEPCKAKPIAKPAAPTTATREAVCTPNRPSAAITTTVSTKPYTMLLMNEISIGSASALRPSKREVRDRSAPASQRPNTKMMLATSRFMAKGAK